jgi:L-lactate utilization protein LutB
MKSYPQTQTLKRIRVFHVILVRQHRRRISGHGALTSVLKCLRYSIDACE